MATAAALAPQPASAARPPAHDSFRGDSRTAPVDKPPQNEEGVVGVGEVGVGDLRVEEAALAESRFRLAAETPASRSAPTYGSFVRPAVGAITGPYGERRRSGRHPGIDFDGITGDAVWAAGSGTVVHAGQAPAGYSGYGRMVLIDHGNGIQTLYAHLSRVSVGLGTNVRPGDHIGAIGTTGSVTGSHLHFEVRIGGSTVNPGPWIGGG